MFKAEYAGFTRGRIEDNEGVYPGLGVTIAYHGDERGEATVYVYDMRQEDIPDGPTSSVIREEFDKTTSEVLAVRHSEGRKIELVSQYGTGSPYRGKEFLCSEFILSDDHGSRRTFLYLTGANGKFVKIRVTLRTNDEADPTARNFADAVASELWQNPDEQFDADDLHVTRARKH